MQNTQQLRLNITLEEFIPNKNLLQDKVILITGASRGIGRAVSKLFAKSGATCILLARKVKHLELLYDEIIAEDLKTPAIYPFNLMNAKPEDYNDVRRSIDKNFGKLDGIVHAAGHIGSLTPIEQYPLEQWFSLMQLNLNSQFMMTQALLPLLKRSDNAKVIFSINKVAKASKAFWGAYAVSNAGVVSLAETLEKEYESYPNLNFHKIYLDKVHTSLYTSVHPAVDAEELISPEEASLEFIKLYL